MERLAIADFEAAIDREGPDLARWPEALRIEAENLLLTSAEARDLLSAALAIDSALRSLPPIKAPHGLADRIVNRAIGAAPPKDKPRR